MYATPGSVQDVAARVAVDERLEPVLVRRTALGHRDARRRVHEIVEDEPRIIHAAALARNLIRNSLADPVRLLRFAQVQVGIRRHRRERRARGEEGRAGELPAADHALPEPVRARRRACCPRPNGKLPGERRRHDVAAIPIRAAAIGPAVVDVLRRRQQAAVRRAVELRGIVDRFAVGVIQPVERAAAPAPAQRDLAGVVDRVGVELELIDGPVEVRERTQIHHGDAGQVSRLRAPRQVDVLAAGSGACLSSPRSRFRAPCRRPDRARWSDSSSAGIRSER